MLPQLCEVYEIQLGKFAATFVGLRRANFCHFVGFGQVAYRIGQHCSVLRRRLDRVKNGFAEQRILSNVIPSLIPSKETREELEEG